MTLLWYGMFTCFRKYPCNQSSFPKTVMFFLLVLCSFCFAVSWELSPMRRVGVFPSFFSRALSLWDLSTLPRESVVRFPRFYQCVGEWKNCGLALLLISAWVFPSYSAVAPASCQCCLSSIFHARLSSVRSMLSRCGCQQMSPETDDVDTPYCVNRTPVKCWPKFFIYL